MECNVACLITGLGYIGSALAQRLLQQGEQVIGIENFFSTPRSHIERLQRDAGLQIIEGSVANQATLVRAFQEADIDAVFHLAGQVSHIMSLSDPYPDIDINIKGTAAVLEACRKRNPGALVVRSGTRG